jgi:tape measure domain-containing protein
VSTSEGDVRVNIGINLDEVDAKLEALEQKLVGLPDVKARIGITSEGVDSQLAAIRQRLQSRAGNLGITVNLENLEELDSKSSIVRQTFAELVEATSKVVLAPKADISEVSSLAGALASAIDQFELTALALHGTELKPKVDLQELIELNKELDRKQRHWLQTERLLKQRPLTGKVSISTEETVKRTHVVQSADQASATVVQAPPGRPVRPQRGAQATAVAAAQTGPRRALPPARGGFFDRQFITDFTRSIRLLLGTRQSRAGVLASPTDAALEELVREQRQINRQLGRANRQQMFRYTPALSDIRQQQGWEDYEKMVRKSGYSDSEIAEAFNRLAGKNRRLEAGESISNVSPSLLSSSTFKFYPPSKVAGSFRRNPNFKTETIEDGRALDPAIKEYINRRNKRLLGDNTLTDAQVSSAQPITSGAAVAQTGSLPTTRISDALGVDLNTLVTSVGSIIRATDEYTQRQAERIDNRIREVSTELADQKQLQQAGSLATSSNGAAVVSNAILRVLGDALQEAFISMNGGMVRMRRRDIHLNPDELQYKLGSNKKGEIGSLRDVEKWDDDFAGVLSVWRDPRDGKTYVVNGHNRLALAERTNEEWMNVRYIEADSVQEARRKGAMINISEGAGTSIDAAKFFRDTNLKDIDAIRRAGLPLSSGKASKGLALAGLPQELFDAVIRGDLGLDRGAILGGSGLSEDQQREALKFAGKQSKTSNRQLQEYIDFIKHGITKESENPTILGMEKLVETDIRERVKITDGVKTALGKTKRLFAKVAENADILSEQGGNIINVDENQEIAKAAEKILKAFDSIKFTSGPISKAINEGVERLKIGDNMSEIIRDILPGVTAAVEEELEAIFGKKKPATIEEAGTPLLSTPAQSGITVQDVTNSEQQAQLARQQQQAALQAGDERGAEAWGKELQRVQRDRLAADMARRELNQSSLFGVGEFDSSTPLLSSPTPAVGSDDDNLDPETRELFKEIDIAQQEYADSIEKGIRIAREFRELADVVADGMDELDNLGQAISEIDKQIAQSITPVSVRDLDDNTRALPFSDALPVNVEVVGSTPFDDQEKGGSIVSSLRGALDALRQSDARFFAATANQLFESKWALGGESDWEGLSKEEARSAYIKQWGEALSAQPKALPGSVSEIGTIEAASGSIADAFSTALERLQESDGKLQSIGERVSKVSSKIASVLADDLDRQVATESKNPAALSAQDEQQTLYRIRLGKREIEGLRNALELDNKENSNTQALVNAKIKLTASMKLTAKQLAVLAYELDNTPLLDDIKALTPKEIEIHSPGEYLLNARNAFEKIREQAFAAGVIKNKSGSVEIIEEQVGQATNQPTPSIATKSALEVFAQELAKLSSELEATRPYKPSSRMFGGPMSEWSEDQQRQYKEAQSTYRAWDKGQKLASGLTTAVNYNEEFKNNFPRMAVEGLAGLLEGRKGGLTARTTGDLSKTLSALTGRNVPDTRKELAGELRSLSIESAESFIKGILDENGSTSEAGARLGHALIQGIKAALQMRSPSKVLIKIGKEAALSFLIGWQQAMSLFQGLVENTVDKTFDYAVKTPAGQGVDYSTLTGSIADLTIDPPLYQRRLESVGLQNMPTELLAEAGARGTFQDYLPEAKIERIVKQLPGTLERMIEDAFVKSFSQYSSNRFVGADLSPTQAIGTPSAPQDPGIRQKVVWDGLLARDGQTGRIMSRREGLLNSGRIAERMPTGVGGTALPIFDAPRRANSPIADPWYTETGSYKMQSRSTSRQPNATVGQLLLPPARMPEPPVSPIFTAPGTASAGVSTGSFNFGRSQPTQTRTSGFGFNDAMNAVDSFVSGLEAAANSFRKGAANVKNKANQAVNNAQQFVNNVANPFRRGQGAAGGGIPPAGTGFGSGSAAGGGGVTGGLGGPGGPGGPGAGRGGPAGGPAQAPGQFAFNDWLDQILPDRGTGSRQGFEQLNGALGEAARSLREFAARQASAEKALKEFNEQTDPKATGRQRTQAEEDYIDELQDRVDLFEQEKSAAAQQLKMAQLAVQKYGTTGDARAIAEASNKLGGASSGGLAYQEPGAFTPDGIVRQTLNEIEQLRRSGSDLRELFGNLDTRPIDDVNNALAAVQRSLQTIRDLASSNLIDDTDLIRAEQGARRLQTTLENQAAETVGYAQDFETLGIQSEAALSATRRVRDEANRAIQASNLSDAEKARANNARDIQELTYLQEQIRGAQGASGFGGFRGREIGDEALNQALQRTELVNFRRNLEEARRNMQLSPDPAGGFLNDKSYNTAVQAIDRQIANADRAFRVLDGSASDGERAFETMRNAFGVFSDDLGNLIPQLIAFDFAFNILYSTLLPLPRVVVQTTAEFDRLETSISGFLLRTRNLTDASGVINELKQQSLDLGIGFEQAASSYMSLAAALQGTRLEGQEEGISRTLLTAGRGMGLSSDQLNRTTAALTQIVGKGTLQMEELRQQLAEQMPGALQISARAFGVTTRELYKMVSAGEIAGDEFVEKFIGQLRAEGADVNVVANSFASLQDQLGSAMQQMAAVAGQPLFMPLTLGLKLLVETIKALIPLAGLLSVGILVIGSNMAKTALGIGSWRGAMGQLFGAGMELAKGNRAGAAAALAQARQPAQSPLLGANGQPLQQPGATPAGRSQRPGFGASLGRTATGLGQAGAAIRSAFDQMMQPVAGGSGRLALSNLNAMRVASTGLGAGLIQAGKGAAGMGVAFAAAIAPILKIYLIIEGISLLIKTFTGELNKLDGAGKAADALSRGEGDENAAKLNGTQRFLSKINPVAIVGRIQEDMTATKVTGEVGKVYQSLLKDGEKYSAWRQKDADLQIKEASLINKTKQDLSEDERKRIDEQIKDVRDARKEEAKKLPFSPSAVSSSLNLIQQTRDNRENAITSTLQREGIGERDIQEFISGDKQLSEVKGAESLSPLAVTSVEAYKKEIEALAELEEGITSTTRALEIFERVRDSMPVSLTSIDAEIKSIQENLANEDIGTPEGRQAFDAGSKQLRLLNTQRDILSLSSEEQNLRVLEQRANAEQAVAAAAQTAGRARLEVLEGERALLESINELQQKRRQFAESKLENQVSVSRAIGFDGDALRGQRELITLQNRNRQAEIRDQRLLINNDRQRAAIERDMKKAELRSTRAQLIATSATQAINYENAKTLAKSSSESPKPEIRDRAVIFWNIAAAAKTARDAANQQAASYGDLLSSADKLYDITQKTADQRLSILTIEAQMADRSALTDAQINFIQEQRNEIEKRQAAAEQQLALEDRRADRLIQSLQERIGLTEKYLSLLQEEQALTLQSRELDQGIVDQKIQDFADRDSGGFFTRMGAYSRTEDTDLLELGRERRRLMEEIANRQQNAALLALDIDKQRLKIEQQIFKLEQEKARIALATQRIQLSSQVAILELQLSESIKADQGRGAPVAPERLQVLQRLGQIRSSQGIVSMPGQSDSNGIGAALDAIEGGFKLLDEEGQKLEKTAGDVGKQFAITTESMNRNIEQQQGIAAKQRQLSGYEIERWWNEFLDNLGGLGTVLSEATAGLSEFRQSVAEGIARGLREGGTAGAISDAAGRLGDRVIGSIVDQFVLKPMEENLFRGIQTLFGPKFGPAPKPEEVIEKTGDKLQEELAKGMKIDESIKTEISAFHETFKQKIDRLFDKTWQPPAGPDYVPPGTEVGTATGIAGTGAFNTGLRTGPAGRIGAGTEYHQDLMFGPQVSMSDKVKLMDQLAKGYEADGRVIEFSNAAVQNERYRSSMSPEEKADLIRRAEVAHYRPNGSRRYAMDFYAPKASETRFGPSVVGQEMLAPVVPGAQVVYGRGGNYGNHMRIMKDGQMVMELGHGDEALALPQNKTLPAAIPAPIAAPPAPQLPAAQAVAASQSLPHSQRIDLPPGVVGLGVDPFRTAPPIVQQPPAGVPVQAVPQSTERQVFPLGPQDLAALDGVGQAASGTSMDLIGLGNAAAQATAGITAAPAATQGAVSGIPLPAELTQGTQAATGELAARAKELAQSYVNQKAQSDQSKDGFSGLNQAMSGAAQAIGAIGMGIAGVQQMSEGGTYNTLMGLSGIFGSISSITGMFTPGGMFGARANGGPVNARQPYIVGERGPELFMPNTSGSVVSANDTTSMFKQTRAQLEANRRKAEQGNQISFAAMSSQPIDVRYESRVINGVEYVTTEQLRLATREAAERGRSLTLQSIQGSVRTRRRLNV